ncbi:hypothetical protein CIPAW_09G116900 [Carya illinoinensis]|nr:hypothetical protein CIPAW_09G116900 [Carya illinoinensis]
MQTKDAVITLEGVLAGRHDSNIDETLNMYQVSADRWWSSLYKVIEGLAVMSRLANNRHQQLGCDFEDRPLDWDHVEV